MDGHAQPEIGKQLSFVGKFIDDHYLTQPPWVQSGTFIAFVVLFAYGFINLLSGFYALKGNLYVQTPGRCLHGTNSCSSFAKYYDVRWGAREFASNSKGEYFITIGFPEFLAVLPRASHDLTFIKDDQVIDTKRVHFSRWGSEFADVTLPSNPLANAAPPIADSFSIIPTVRADGPPGDYRLLIQGIRFSGGMRKADASLELSLNGSVIALKDHLRGDMPAGNIPLVTNQNLDLDSSFYFPMPGVDSLPAKGTIRLTVPRGFFQFYSDFDEQFSLPTEQALGQSLQVTGTKGSLLAVRVVLSLDVTLFNKSDLVDKKEQIGADLLNQGLLAKWTDSPQGFVRETNALWTGEAVQFDVVQKLLTVVIEEDIPIKKVEYKYRFATPNVNGIQFGYSALCLNTALIPKPVLQNALTAHTESEFKNVFAPVSSCTVAAAKSRRKTPGPSNR